MTKKKTSKTTKDTSPKKKDRTGAKKTNPTSIFGDQLDDDLMLVGSEYMKPETKWPKKIPKQDKALVQEITDQLNTILDPELGIGIVDLGLIYEVVVVKRTCYIKMTLTTMGCPIGPMLAEQIDLLIPTIFDEVDDTAIIIVWDPPWTAEKMNPEIRELMQGF